LRNPEVNASGRASADQGGAFIQDEWSVTERWSIVGGARFDHHEAYDWQTSPRLYTVFHATSKLTFKGGVGRGFKAPSLTQLSSEYDVVAPAVASRSMGIRTSSPRSAQPTRPVSTMTLVPGRSARRSSRTI